MSEVEKGGAADTSASTESTGRPRPALSPAKLALREARLRGLGPSASIRRRPREGPLPLSFGQERLWFLEQLNPGLAVYNLLTALRLPADVDEEALERALGEIVRRHEVLRTTFREVDGAPVQVVAPVGGFALPVEEVPAPGEAEREAQARQRASEEIARPFDLKVGPLFRARLLRLGAEDCVLLLCVHHIVSDGWSMGVLLGELGTLHDAYRHGGASPLPEPQVQYADYAAWQREQLQGETLARRLSYWTERLAGSPPLEFPTDHLRPAVPTYRGARERMEFSVRLRERLEALARSEGATLFMVLLGVFQVLLGKYSGSDDVVVGSPAAGRTRVELENLIGFFVNTLALRTDLSGDPSFREVVRRVREVTLGAYEHQDVPFERVVAELQPVRSLSHPPLFRAMFILQNLVPPGDGGGGLRARHVEVEPGTAEFDLTLVVFTPGHHGMLATLEYGTDLFEPATICRILGHLERVLEQVADDPDARLSRLELMGPEERQVLEEWNRTDAEVPDGPCIHHLFEAQAARTPDALAVVFEDKLLTYRELNERANRLARHLAGLGVDLEERVAVCLERGPEMVVSLLAVLKAGGAYVPLDPANPDAWLRYQLEDSAPMAVLTHGSLAARFAGAGVPRIELDAASSVWAAGHETNPGHRALLPGHLAYVIYTSGSTGRPKGVMITHRAVLLQVAAVQAAFGLRPDDRSLQFASIAFDVAVEEIFGALLSGAALVMRGKEWLEDARTFWGACARHQVTVVDLPTRFWQLLLDEPAAVVPECVRLLVIGGEAVEPAAVEAWFRRGGHRPRLLNNYGPTETTVNATLREVTGDPATWRSIGRPMANTRAYPLDAWARPVPVGVAGELYIGGGQVARGYLGRPGLTAERFVPDPFGGEAGARLYRTGDRVRWSADGSLEFLGRADFQLKVRGFRIEPGEIEARLCEHPAVRETVVLARAESPGDQRLVAYWAGETEVEAEALRLHLLERLPEYMVPAAYVHLDAFPLTPSGKVDRRALPTPQGDAYARRGYEAPSEEGEQALAEVWSEVLGVERVGRWDHFFELGGHSLLAVRVISRVRQMLGAEVGIGDLFERPVLTDFARGLREDYPDGAGAARVEASSAARVADVPVPVRATGSERPLFLVHDGYGSIQYAQVLARQIGTEIPVHALPPLLDAECSLRTIHAMGARLVRMIQSVQQSGPYRIAGYSFGGLLAYEAAAQFIGLNQEVEFLGLIDTAYPDVSQRGTCTTPPSPAQVLRILCIREGTEGWSESTLRELASTSDSSELGALLRAGHEAGLFTERFSVERVSQLRQEMWIYPLALWDYTPPQISVPVCYFQAMQSSGTDPCNGWRALLKDTSLRVTRVPGTHRSMLDPDHIPVLGQALSCEIARATKNNDGFPESVARRSLRRLGTGW